MDMDFINMDMVIIYYFIIINNFIYYYIIIINFIYYYNLVFIIIEFMAVMDLIFYYLNSIKYKVINPLNLLYEKQMVFNYMDTFFNFMIMVFIMVIINLL